MLLKYFYDKALAHASYMVGCQKTGEAILIDPHRNIAHYLDAARREGLTIVGTAETHIHADYVSGSRELAEKVGAKIYVSDEGPVDWKYTFVHGYEHMMLEDGSEFYVGNIKFNVIHTPGHTPESISFMVTDVGGGADKPIGLFTGDFVFVGSTGRPDLLEEVAGQAGSAVPGARSLYHSIQKFLQLPGYLQIWPSHGAGSACGKGLGAIPSSTVGYEGMYNEALQFESEDEFVEYILTDQPEAPPYFAVMKNVNKHGPKVIGDEGLPPRLQVTELFDAVERYQVIDLRPAKDFSRGHVAKTINVPTKNLAQEGGWHISYRSPLYLIASTATLGEVMRVFREIGVDNIIGYFDADDVIEAGLANESYESKTPTELIEQIESGEVYLVDVRQQAEWDAGHIPKASHSFLGGLLEAVEILENDKPIVFQCRSGARSAVACSIAQAKGIKNVINLDGGIIQWDLEGYPVITDEPQTAGGGLSRRAR